MTALLLRGSHVPGPSGLSTTTLTILGILGLVLLRVNLVALALPNGSGGQRDLGG
jgi:hypothetical protein